MLPDVQNFPSLQTLPDMIASTQGELSNGIKHKLVAPVYIPNCENNIYIPAFCKS